MTILKKPPVKKKTILSKNIENHSKDLKINGPRDLFQLSDD